MRGVHISNDDGFINFKKNYNKLAGNNNEIFNQITDENLRQIYNATIKKQQNS